MAIDIGRRLTHDEALSIGLTESEYQALQEVGSNSIATTEYTSSSHNKSSGTSAGAGVGAVLPKLEFQEGKYIIMTR
ncbi:conjugal transfer protein TraG [Orientia tsutsugamushi]|nr:hypothetical protein [Orientia tsutsugamushi]SPP25016.1 conjugal transfer protein TraG [Orientia tsutsugamushi]